MTNLSFGRSTHFFLVFKFIFLEHSLANMRNPMSSTNSSHNSYENSNFYDYPTSSSSAFPTTLNGFAPVKTEANYDDEYPSNMQEDYPPAVSTSPVGLPNPILNGSESLRSSIRTTKPNPRFFQAAYISPDIIEERVQQATRKAPRKYRIKPETEKVNPVYKQKREKNNDAVRRSREKAKAVQAEKETRLQTLETNLRLFYEHYQKVMQYYRNNCHCSLKHPSEPKW